MPPLPDVPAIKKGTRVLMTTPSSVRRTRITLCAAAMAIGLAACSTSDPEPSGAPAGGGEIEEAASDIPEGMGSTEDDGVFPRTVNHFMGETEIPAEPQRIVVLGTGQLDGLLTLDIIPVGTVARAGNVIVPPYLLDAFPEHAADLGEVTATGTSAGINYEAIVALEPDLILDGGGEGLDNYDTLSEIAPTVITEGSGVNWKQDYLILASALGRLDEARAWLDEEYYARADAIAESFGDSAPEVTFLRFHADRTRIYGVGSFVGSVGEDASLARPESQRFGDTSLDISMEQMELVDGDYIFYGVQGASDETPAEQFITNPLWDNLPAVQAGNDMEVPHDPFVNSAGPGAARIVLETIDEALVE